MRRNNFTNSITRKKEKQTSYERKMSRYLNDPIRFESGHAHENVKLGAIKAVRLG